MLSEEQKQQILCPLSSNKSSLLRVLAFVSERMIDWHQIKMINLIWKDVKMVKEKQKTANTLPTVFAQKFTFESPDLHFWENNWFTTINNDQNDCEKQVFCVKEPFFYITFESSCPKKHSKSPTNHFLLQLEQVWCKNFLLCFCSSFSQ